MNSRYIYILVIVVALILSAAFIIGCSILGNFIFKGLLSLGIGISQGLMNS